MKKEIKEKWLEALRSGKYQQGRMRLRNSREEFCCLGVLVDIVHPEWWVASPDPGIDYVVSTPDYHAGPLAAVPPREFAVEVGLPEHMPTGKSTFLTLAHMNDGGDSFHCIADFIEREL